MAAVGIGGTRFTGGRGSLQRTGIGPLIIAIVNNGPTLRHVERDVRLVV